MKFYLKTIYLLLLTLALNYPIGTMAQEGASTHVLKEVLSDKLGDEWRAAGPEVTRDQKSLEKAQAVEIWNEYGLSSISRRLYRQIGVSGISVNVEIFKTKSTAGAWGLMTFERQSDSWGRLTFQRGRYVVRVSTNTPGKETVAGAPIPESLVAALHEKIGAGDGQTPVLPAHLPKVRLVAGSEIYILGPKTLSQDKTFGDLASVIDFSSLPELVVANYEHSQNGASSTDAEKMRLLIVEFYTPQEATENFELVQRELQSLTPAEQQSRILKRVGNYVVEAAGVLDRLEAEKLIGEIKYEQKVYWSGRKLSDIPLEFRPLDPAALREMMRTGAILTRSLIWMGMLLMITLTIGLVIGAIFFGWRRYQDRKYGSAGLFSDGGGSIFLHLEDENSQESSNRGGERTED